MFTIKYKRCENFLRNLGFLKTCLAGLKNVWQFSLLFLKTPTFPEQHLVYLPTLPRDPR